MITASDVATTLGRTAINVDDLCEAVTEMMRENSEHTPVATDLLCIFSKLCRAEHDAQAYHDLIQREVWPSRPRTNFFVRAPLDHLVWNFAQLETDEDSEHVYNVFTRACQEGANVARMACGILPACARFLPKTKHMALVCNLLAALLEHSDEVRNMMLDVELLRALAGRMQCYSNVVEVMNVIRQIDTFEDPIQPIVDRCAVLLSKSQVAARLHENEHLREALSFLENYARVQRWRDYLVPHVVVLARNAWPMEMGTFMSSMLTTTSVHLVVSLENTARLRQLLRAAHAYASNSLAWRAVRGQVRKQWPAKYAEYLPQLAQLELVTTRQQRKSTSGAPSLSATCPITLDICIHPVVASDGHTYERDALMRHLSIAGFISPMTKGMLEYHLYENRVMYS